MIFAANCSRWPIRGGGADNFLGNDLVFQYPLVVINIVDEFVQPANALLESALNPLPLPGANDSWDHVEWEDLLGPGGIA